MKRSGATRIPPFVVGILWSVTVLLAMIGVAAAAGRGAHRGDLATRADPVRQQIMERFHRSDPFAHERREELSRFDRRFALHPVVTVLHVLPGGVFLVLALLQFSSGLRNRHIRLHRWSGRLLVLVGSVAAATGLFFGVLMPIGGVGETGAIVVFGGFFLIAISRAYVAIRRREVARHREWMIRAFAVAIGISTVRLAAAVFDLLLTPAGFRPPEIFVLSLWTGWAITLAGAELWIAYTRRRGPAVTLPAGAA